MNDIVERLRREVVWESEVGDVLNAAADEIERLRGDAEVSRLRLVAAHAEIERLRLAIRRLADQDATLSVQDGNVTVTLDATLTAEERVAIEYFAAFRRSPREGDATSAATLRKLLERFT
jgi:tRNA(Arg) A34 adenosine deaminase TadA